MVAMETAEVERALRAAAPQAFEGTAVLFAFLFGSTASGRARQGSDVDVAVYLDPATAPEQYLPLTLDLAGRLADASGLPRIEVVVMNDAPLPLLGSILRERVVISSRDEVARVRFEGGTRSMFFDFDIHARRLDRELLARTRDGRR